MFRYLKIRSEISRKFYFLTFFLFVLMYLPGYMMAQVNIDSIESIIRKAKANDKPELYLKYAGELAGKNNEAAFEYGQKALAFYVKTGNMIKEADARSAIASVISYKNDYKLSIDWYQQALRLYQQKNENEKISLCLINIGFNYSLLNDFNEAISFYKQSLKISSGKYPDKEGKAYFNYGLALSGLDKRDEALEKIKTASELFRKSDDIINLSIAYYNLGWIYCEKSLYQLSIENFKIADSLKARIGDLKGRAKALNQIGNDYWRWGKYDNAIASYQAAIRIFDKINNSEGVANCLNNIGLIYDNIGEENKSLDFHKQALQIRRQINKPAQISESLNNIAITKTKLLGKKLKKQYGSDWENIVYKSSGSDHIISIFSECLANFNESKKIRDSLNDVEGMAEICSNIGNIYTYAGNFKLAEINYKKAITIYTAQNNIAGAALNKLSLGYIYYRTGNYKLALSYLEEVLEFFKQHNLNEYLKDTYDKLSDLYETQGNTNKALEYYKLYTVIKDTLLNTENYKQFAELQTQYETEKKQQRIEMLNKDQALKDTRIKQQFYFIVFFILVSLLVGALVVLFYRQSKQRKLTNIELERKNVLITEQKKEITDSIQYASRLQQAILPPNELLMQLIPKHFIFFKPRDIVSGDYYYVAEKNGLAIIVTADCTGHGVPGALMSMLGAAILNELLAKMTDISPDHILNELRTQIIRSLHQSGRAGEHRDGMDLALYILDNANRQLYFSGANNPVIIARNGELIELKPDKMPIGIYEKGNLPFSSQIVPIQDNDMIYTFSDGIIDQFGGPNGKKFLIKRFREFLIDIHKLEVSVQRERLDKAFTEWKGTFEQVDDILVIGVKV